MHGIGENANGSNYGGYFEGKGSSGTNYGIYATALGSGTNYAGFFDGDVEVNGVLTIMGGVVPSDQQFKTNINDINNAQAIIEQLQPKEFYFDTTAYPQIHFSNTKQYGLIAQEVEQVLPELVNNSVFPAQYDNLGNQTSATVNYKSLNYNAFISILMKGMQEQQSNLNVKDSVITNLEDRLTALEACLNANNLCITNGKSTTDTYQEEGQSINLENLNAIILDQNLPNPFAEKTVINYLIPNDVVEAQLLFYDINGRIIKQVEINERGSGKITVYGENLQNGIYTYSLIADGQLIATKKMVKTN